MAVDKLVDSTQLDADLTSVANAIRTKGGTSAALAFPAGFVNAIYAIETGGGGDDTVILPGANSTMAIGSDTYQPVWVINTWKNRRCILKASGNHSMWIGSGTGSDYLPFSGLYPLPIPSGATKVNISATGPTQIIYMTYSWDGSRYIKVDDSGWVNLPITNGEISPTAEYIGISFRVKSSSPNFTDATQPSNVSVTFE